MNDQGHKPALAFKGALVSRARLTAMAYRLELSSEALSKRQSLGILPSDEREQFIDSEIVESALFIAVALRVHNEALGRKLIGSVPTVGTLNGAPLPLKDALDKIIHAKEWTPDSGNGDPMTWRGQAQDQLPTAIATATTTSSVVGTRPEPGHAALHLRGSYQGDIWTATIDLTRFCQQVRAVLQ